MSANRRQLAVSLDPFSKANLSKQRNADTLAAAADEVGGVAADGSAFGVAVPRGGASGARQASGKSAGRLRLRGSVQDAFADDRYKATVRGDASADALSDDAAAVVSSKKKKGTKKLLKKAGSKKRSALSDDYTSADADAAMDDIFGFMEIESDFSDGDDVAEAPEPDNEPPAAKKKMAHIKADEKAYCEYLEEKARKKRGVPAKKRARYTAPSDDESEDLYGDEQEDEEAEEAEEGEEPAAQRRRLDDDEEDKLMPVARTEGEEDLLAQVRALRGKQREERGARTGTDLSLEPGSGSLNLVDADAAVSDTAMDYARSLVDGFNALLAMRVQLQPAVGAAVRLPQWYALPEFAAKAGADAASFSDARGTALEVLGDLLGAANAPAALAQRTLREAAAVRAKGPAAAGVASALYSAFAAVDAQWQKQIDASVEAVSVRVVRAQGAGKVIDAPLLDQIRAVTSGTERLMHRAQRNRTNARILGHPEHFAATAAEQALRVAGGNVDREIFDDVDFVKELVQRSGQWSRALEATSLTTLVDPNKGEAKKGHHRRTKGRTVNYDPRPKIVGFMVPEQFPAATTMDAIFASLFQG
jgi:protein AATF/BFR2